MWLRVTAHRNIPTAGKVMGRTPLCPFPSRAVMLGPAAIPQGFTAAELSLVIPAQAELSLVHQNPVKLKQRPRKLVKQLLQAANIHARAPAAGNLQPL